MRNALVIAATLLVAACGTINPTVVTVEPTTIRPALAPAAPATRGGIWSAQARPLFEDTRARAPGDTLTIAINEKLSASQSSKSNIEKTGSTAFSVPVIQGLPGKTFQGASAQADSSNKYDGKGETAADNAFVGTITATVIEVLPNGNLVVSGEKQIGVNRQVEILRFSGIVDPRWIAPGNTVSSTRVADARLEFHGNGQLSEAQRMGWLQRFFLTFLPVLETAMNRRLVTALQFLMIVAAFYSLSAQPARATRLKDIAAVEGVRINQLIGYGIVVGLDGSGDQTQQTPFTTQSLQSMLQQLGINIPTGPNAGQVQLKNVAAVMVTAQLAPFALPGQQLDVTVSSMGNAKSLRGGTLLMTPLKGADGQVYAIAQGNLAVGGAGASSGGAKTQVNHLSAGRIPNGGTVERAVEWNFSAGQSLRLLLHTADFTVARRVAEAINAEVGPGTASASDARVVEVRAPSEANARVTFLARLEALQVQTPAAAARVIINARTGSVVMNQAVRLDECAVAHGNLTVSISNTPVVGSAPPLSLLPAPVTSQTDIQVKQDGQGIMALPAGANLADVVKALNLLGASPADLVAILQAMQASGSLRAELEVI